MKKVVLAITLALFGVTALGTLPSDAVMVYAQKKGEDKKKDPPGPPVVRDKGRDQKPKDPPKRDKKPE
jgi:hypothetical protein